MKLIKYLCVIFVTTTIPYTLFSETPQQDLKNLQYVLNTKKMKEENPGLSPKKALALCAGGAFLLATGNALPCLKIVGGLSLLLIPTWIATEIMTTLNGVSSSYPELEKKALQILNRKQNIEILKKNAQIFAHQQQEIQTILNENHKPPLPEEKLNKLKESEKFFSSQLKQTLTQLSYLQQQESEDDEQVLSDAEHYQKINANSLKFTTELYSTFNFPQQHFNFPINQ